MFYIKQYITYITFGTWAENLFNIAKNKRMFVTHIRIHYRRVAVHSLYSTPGYIVYVRIYLFTQKDLRHRHQMVEKYFLIRFKPSVCLSVCLVCVLFSTFKMSRWNSADVLWPHRECHCKMDWIAPSLRHLAM